MKYGANMISFSLSVLCLLACVASLAAVRYGDYSVPHMPQYSDQHEDTDLASGHEEYSARSPDASARLDYKYEEEHQEKSDDFPVKDVIDERMWDKRIKKKRKPLILPIRDQDKYTFDETEPEIKLDKRFVMRKSGLRKRNFPKQSNSQTYVKHTTVDQSNLIDDIDNHQDYGHKEDVETTDGVDAIESILRYRSTIRKKPRRKPRDRALWQPDWRGNNANLEKEEIDTRLGKQNFEMKNARRFSRINNEEGIKRKYKSNYDYEEYYDMKRVQNMKNRLPGLLKQTKVRTVEAKSTSHSGHWLNRRADSSVARSVNEPTVMRVTSEVINSTRAFTAVTVNTSSETKSTKGNSSDLSLAQKSRQSILKKAQRKETFRNISTSTKPPVLMQVTRKMQTLVMVEPQSPETAMRAREVLGDTPDRLRRARRLMRQKLVAGARSIHELTDNWDEMICDYIDVSLLDTDTASYVDINVYVINFLSLTFLFIYV